MPDIQKVKTAKRERALAINRASLNEETRTVEAIFVSEAPVRSWAPGIGEYDEILDCTPESFNARRFETGAQFLKEHDRSLVVGKIDGFRFENRQGICTLRYAKTPLGEEEWGMLKDGIRNKFSVSYYVHTLQPEKVSEEDGNVFRAVSWEGLEVSVVSVEADPNCQALRSEANQTNETTFRDMNITNQARGFREQDTTRTGNDTPPAFDKAKAEAEIRAALLKTSKEINDSAANFKRAGQDVDELARQAITEGWTADQFRGKAVEALKPATDGSRANVANTTPSRIEVVREFRGIGELVAADKGFAAMKGRRNSTHALDIPEYRSFREALQAQQRATTLTTTVTGWPGYVPVTAPIEIGVQRPTVADLLSTATTGLNSVPYVVEDTFTNGAAAVAEGAAKPEMSFDLSFTSAPVKKIAVWTKASDEILEDAPTVQGYIQARLIYGVEIAEEAALLNGGGGSSVTGILQTSGIQTQALGANTVPDAIFKAITKIRSTGFYEPDGIVIHPNDWEALRLLKDGNDQYYGGGPFTGAYGNGGVTFVDRFWGLPVVVTTSITENTALVGAFKLGATIWRRKGLTVDMTNTDSDDFQKNLVTMRVEERFALTVWRPKAFCTVTGI